MITIANGEEPTYIVWRGCLSYYCVIPLLYYIKVYVYRSGGARMDNLALLKHRKQVLERELENCRYGRQDLYEDLLEIEIMIEREELSNEVRYGQDADT